MRSILAALFCASLLVACDGHDSNAVQRKATAFERALAIGEIEALADGNAYLVGDGAIFFLAGSDATKVEGITFEGEANMTALADGSAILVLTADGQSRAYWLRGVKATPIVETDHVTIREIQSRPNGLFFVQSVKDRKKALKADQTYQEPDRDE